MSSREIEARIGGATGDGDCVFVSDGKWGKKVRGGKTRRGSHQLCCTGVVHEKGNFCWTRTADTLKIATLRRGCRL